MINGFKRASPGFRFGLANRVGQGSGVAIVQAFKEKFSRISPNNTLENPNECMDTPLSNVQKFPILKSVEEGENELEIENKALLYNLEDEEPLVDKLKFEEES